MSVEDMLPQNAAAQRRSGAAWSTRAAATSGTPRPRTAAPPRSLGAHWAPNRPLLTPEVGSHGV